MSQVLPYAAESWPAALPFSPQDFLRRDESSNAQFAVPRFLLSHRKRAVESLTRYYSAELCELQRPSQYWTYAHPTGARRHEADSGYDGTQRGQDVFPVGAQDFTENVLGAGV